MGQIEAYERQVREALFVSRPDELYPRSIQELDELLIPDSESGLGLHEYAWAARGHMLPETDSELLRAQYRSEAGDVTYCLVASGSLPGHSQVPFEAILARTNLLLGRSGNPESLSVLDELASNAIGTAVAENYRPDYFKKESGRLSPLALNGARRNGYTFTFQNADFPAPAHFYADGYWTLLQTVAEGMNAMRTHRIGEKNHIDAVALAIGSIIAVGNTRLQLSFEEILEHNVQKIRRRSRNNTLEQGHDPERSSETSRQVRAKDAASLMVRALFDPQANRPLAAPTHV